MPANLTMAKIFSRHRILNCFSKWKRMSGGSFPNGRDGIPPDTTSRTERFDLVIGSGGKGQTYLYWKGDQLFQLPVTYWTELGQWVNSPGYRDGSPISAGAFLHDASIAMPAISNRLPPPLNRYRNTEFVLGISCEKCHGPGQEHIARAKLSGSRLVPAAHRQSWQDCPVTGRSIYVRFATRALANSRLRHSPISREKPWTSILSYRTSTQTPTSTFTAARWSC